MLSEVFKEQHSDAENIELKPAEKKINLLLAASDSDDENEHALVCTALDCCQAEPIISMDACPLEWWLKHCDIVNKKRVVLSPANVDILVCLSDWLVKKQDSVDL
ncbi:hypothetical protein UY3_07270 [Chelonia mydas]|uniref:HAT C-terminal dimerisation domain-containing protein n=1 Tax=Chelonia mydas TaxID=8469 RepID=M7BIR0_CHEMY|nr:hypothetical protein UY3_07270 [Chelonia mydas]